MAAKARWATAKFASREIFCVLQLGLSAKSGLADRHANHSFGPIVSICGRRKGALHGQIDPRDLRNILLFYSTAKTICNMFNLVTETLKHVVKYLNIK